MKGIYYKLKNQNIETERTVIRGYLFKDTDDYYELVQDENLCSNIGRTVLKSVEKAESEVIRRVSSSDTVYLAVTEKQSDMFIGSISLMDDVKRNNPDCIEIGFFLGEKLRGKGIMSESLMALFGVIFEKCETQMITAYRFPENVKSEKILKKLGFKEEGTLRYSYKMPNGICRDEVCYSITREEFNKLFHVEQLNY